MRINRFQEQKTIQDSVGSNISGLNHIISGRLHRCWWRMLETKCVGDNFKMLVMILVTNILYLLKWASGTIIQKMSPRSLFCRQHSKIVTTCKSSTSQFHQHYCGPTWDHQDPSFSVLLGRKMVIYHREVVLSNFVCHRPFRLLTKKVLRPSKKIHWILSMCLEKIS